MKNENNNLRVENILENLGRLRKAEDEKAEELREDIVAYNKATINAQIAIQIRREQKQRFATRIGEKWI